MFSFSFFCKKTMLLVEEKLRSCAGKVKKGAFYLVLCDFCSIFAAKLNEGTEKFPLLILWKECNFLV